MLDFPETNNPLELLDQLRELTPTKIQEARARIINAAREQGCTWRQISIALDMTEAGIQRIPGVQSAWNARHNNV